MGTLSRRSQYYIRAYPLHLLRGLRFCWFLDLQTFLDRVVTSVPICRRGIDKPKGLQIKGCDVLELWAVCLILLCSRSTTSTGLWGS